ncbi:hypothetical protein CHS0354_016613 [Potamilus streckersoni]|uniref:Non-structural maintenance of chromosomes element 4 n=1 Tax=Potamilus streckersoni TaxID=2493646 RepID=A0AAE0THQ9_9BIVA|nr:hypothetical protein CHS0354_016613 [Potamilus streckersoni]
MDYEDKQTPEERRRIRDNYRNLIDNIQNNQEDLINPASDALNERLQEAEELFRPVKTPREAVLDSQAMNLIANLGRKKAQALHTEFVKFQSLEFAEKLITSLGDNTSSQGARLSSGGWHKLGVSVQPFFSKSPAFHFMCGSFERGARPQKEPRQLKRKEKDNTVGKETVPRQLQSFGEEEKNEATTEEVDRVYRILQEQSADKRMYWVYSTSLSMQREDVLGPFYIPEYAERGLLGLFYIPEYAGEGCIGSILHSSLCRERMYWVYSTSLNMQ